MIVGICAVRNEGDIVGQVLRSAAQDHDLILVVDVASTDDTLAEIRAVERRYPRVACLGSLGEPVWAQGVRRHVWARFRGGLPRDTWWSIVDGDEFADEPLAPVVAAAEAEGADHVQGAFATFAYTRSEAEEWRSGRETLADRSRPVEERRRFFRVAAYSVRLFKDHPLLRWNDDAFVPRGLIRPFHRRVCYRHYQHRDLDQLALRLESRSTLELPEWHKEMHYHWHYALEEALHPDDDPALRTHVPGRAIELSERWSSVWTKDPIRRGWARLRRLWRARTPQEAPALFGEVPVAEILGRATSPEPGAGR